MRTDIASRTVSFAVTALLLGVLLGFSAISGALEANAAPVKIKSVDAEKYLVYKQEPGYFKYAFASPSGNLRCQITQYEDSAPWGCVAVAHAWRDPKLPDYYRAGCTKAKLRLAGAMLAVYPGSGFVATCASFFTDAKYRGKTLPFNNRITVNKITCESLKIKGREAMRCAGPNEATFTMSRAALAFVQPKNWQ